MTSTAPSFVPTSGDDVDEIIAEHGGVGEWEMAGREAPVERWEFPRFAGATESADMYLSRTGIGDHDTDVETLVAWASAPRNIVGGIMVLGDPGCGKTALIEAAATHAEAELLTVLCTPDHTRDSLFLKFVGEGNGDCTHHDHVDGEVCALGCNRSPYTLGPIPYAAKHGLWLYLDEYMLLVDGVKPVTYALADGRRFLPEGHVDGSPMEIAPGFRLLVSSNPLVRGASLPEPVSSRFSSTTIHVETSAAILRDLDMDEAVVAAWEALGSAGLWQPAVREVRLADYWLGVDATQAASAFLPEHCPESQREAIRNTVVSFLGGNLRADGRLIVR